MTRNKTLEQTWEVSYQAPITGFWTFQSQDESIMLARELLPPMAQDESATHTSKEGFREASIPEYFKLFGAIYASREDPLSEDARQFIRSSIRNIFPSTSTKLIYTPEGSDKIIHGYGTESPIEHDIELVGPDGRVLNVLNPEVSLALTGKRPEEIEELMQYINGTSAYIWRLNEKPDSADERVARLPADSMRAGLGCYGHPLASYSALGIKFLSKDP